MCIDKPDCNSLTRPLQGMKELKHILYGGVLFEAILNIRGISRAKMVLDIL